MNAIASLSRTVRATLVLALAAVTLVSVNLLAREALRHWRVDLTSSGLYTVSEATRRVLSGLDDAVTLRLYYSREIGDRVPSYGQHAERVRNLLALYESLGNGKLTVETYDPRPFSDEEDRAVAAGLQGASLGDGQGSVYLGLVGTNSTDDQEVIGFFTLERADFLEYDLTKLVHKLAEPKRKVVGLLTGLPLAGGMDPQGGPIPPWLVYQQVAEFFQVKAVSADMAEVPADVDLLLIVAPDKLTERAAYAIDQFALSGEPVLVFADPFSEVRRGEPSALADGDPLLKLLKAWGATVAPKTVVGDIDHARRVQYSAQGQPVVANYVVWMNFDRENLDREDAIFSNIEHLVVATPGVVAPVEGAGTTFTPLITTSANATLIEDDRLVMPDPAQLLQSYKPAGKAFALAARLGGEAKTAFPDGPPKDEEGKAAAPAEALKGGRINVVVVADADLLYDSFWAEAREVLGQRLVLPRAHNADFLINALENLSGGFALSGLRGRGIEERPFRLIADMRREAEGRYRAQEQALKEKLEETQKKLAEIQSKAQDGRVVLSEEDKEAILGFRQDVVANRQELRAVQAALREDIERLEMRVKFINTAGIPLLVGAGLIVFVLARRLRRRRSAAQGGARS
jgi:ABC-type uncharacterized transport system involved in gliding motility auxiliary subunit